MSQSGKLVVHESDLPMQIELVGKSGKRVSYLLLPAGRKFGACLNKLTAPLRRVLK